jgi:predicted anti-sigma-YlaC factor YlaD
MRCRHVRRAISRMRDGEPVAEDVRILREHLACCPACVAFEADLARQAELVRDAVPLAELTEGLTAEILAGHRLQHASRRLQAISAEILHPGRKYAMWAACVAAAVFAIVSYLATGENRDAATGEVLPVGGMFLFNAAMMFVAGILLVGAPQVACFDTWLIGKLSGQEICWPSPYKIAIMRGLGLAGLVGCCVVHYLLLVSPGIAF